jgi:hypothetical protein
MSIQKFLNIVSWSNIKFYRYFPLISFQAQISAALTPAFVPDARLHVKSLAFRTAAAYVCSGINKKVSDLGRVLKSLYEALEGLGSKREDVDGIGPLGKELLRLSILKAWAEIQNCSSIQNAARDAIAPYLLS